MSCILTQILNSLKVISWIRNITFPKLYEFQWWLWFDFQIKPNGKLRVILLHRYRNNIWQLSLRKSFERGYINKIINAYGTYTGCLIWCSKTADDSMNSHQIMTGKTVKRWRYPLHLTFLSGILHLLLTEPPDVLEPQDMPFWNSPPVFSCSNPFPWLFIPVF